MCSGAHLSYVLKELLPLRFLLATSLEMSHSIMKNPNDGTIISLPLFYFPLRPKHTSDSSFLIQTFILKWKLCCSDPTMFTSAYIFAKKFFSEFILCFVESYHCLAKIDCVAVFFPWGFLPTAKPWCTHEFDVIWSVIRYIIHYSVITVLRWKPSSKTISQKAPSFRHQVDYGFKSKYTIVKNRILCTITTYDHVTEHVTDLNTRQ